MRQKNDDFFTEKDVLGQEKPAVFIKSENKTEGKRTLNYSNEYELPSIKTRYFSMLLDIIVILLVSLGVSTFFETIGGVPEYIRGITFLIVVILYEPVLISTGCTIGQYITNIRVRRISNPVQKIFVINALFRLVIKVLLGWISFLTITFNDNRRAIHDFTAGSIVIVPKEM